MDKEIQNWKKSNILNNDFVEQLKIKDESKSEFFNGTIKFGTGGMRGLMGPGPNAINEITIGRVTSGLADYCNLKSIGKPTVIIGYDNRRYSKRFANISAGILSQHNVRVYIFSTMIPTPILSYAIRKIKATAGIMITASHNSREYNGYKVYDSTGCQLLPESVQKIKALSRPYQTEYSFQISQQNITLLGNKILSQYVGEFTNYISADSKTISIGYSPEHGTGSIIIDKLLKKYNFNNVTYVTEQWNEDPDFTNTLSPNPENPAAFELLLSYGKKYNLDLLLATDPDADRLGSYYRDKTGEYQRLTGNQIGAIILNYLIKFKTEKNKKEPFVVKTIVTSDLGEKIAKKNGIKTVEVLTGFKYIGDVINKLDNKQFVFAYEESFGYLANPIVRDKDGIQISLILSEIANSLKLNGMTLGDYLEKIYDEYGYYREDLLAINLRDLNEIVDKEFFIEQMKSNLSADAIIIEDYFRGIKFWIDKKITSPLDLPKENVTKYRYSNGDWVCIRPSGTEPKIKIYYGTSSRKKRDVEEKIQQLFFMINEIITKSKKV